MDVKLSSEWSVNQVADRDEDFLSDEAVQADSTEVCWISDLDLCRDWNLPPGPPYRPDQTLILALFS